MHRRKLLKGIIHFLVIGIILSPFIFFKNNLSFPPEVSYNIILSSLLLSACYLFNAIYLIPEFIHKRQYKSYLISIFLVLSFLLLCLFLATGFSPPIEINKDLFPKPDPLRVPLVDSFLTPTIFLLGNILIRYFMILGLGLGIELLFMFDSERSRNDEMARQKAITELNFLKNQLNPHFLLNSLNNIYALARKKSEETTNAILLLSDLLRHVLYESGKSQIKISQEIDFIKTYICLEKLKFNEEDGPKINFKIDVKDPDYQVVPLIMTTLVENAFKHGISFISPSFILISLIESEIDIRFSVINSMQKGVFKTPQVHQRGVGIKNLDKQLQLSYPGKFKFNQVVEDNLFKSFLILKK